MDAEKIIRFEALKKAFSLHQRPAAVLPALPTGCPSVDEAVGGLHRAGLNELCGRSASGALFLELLLHNAHQSGSFLALVDACDGFDPSQYSASLLRRLLWVRCAEVPQAVRAVDLLIRDGNLPLVVLDLQTIVPSALRRIPASIWHRYARLLDGGGPTVLVFSSSPMVEGARLRLHCSGQWPLEALGLPRRHLSAQLQPAISERAGARWEVPDVRRHTG